MDALNQRVASLLSRLDLTGQVTAIHASGKRVAIVWMANVSYSSIRQVNVRWTSIAGPGEQLFHTENENFDWDSVWLDHLRLCMGRVE